jgi:hypothetical protein
LEAEIMSNSTVRAVLLVDALVSGATGLLLAVAAPVLESWLGLPAALLRYAGLVLLPFAVAVAWLGSQAAPPKTGVQAIVASNFAWVAASILLLVAGGVNPTALGVAFCAVPGGGGLRPGRTPVHGLAQGS